MRYPWSCVGTGMKVETIPVRLFWSAIRTDPNLTCLKTQSVHHCKIIHDEYSTSQELEAQRYLWLDRPIIAPYTPALRLRCLHGCRSA